MERTLNMSFTPLINFKVYIKRRWQENYTQENYTENILMTQITTMVWSLT